jgi:tetratricopeptide (TPR) repeat protein
VSSNERAWPASRAWVKSHGLPNTELSFHSLWWLQYGYLQQGRYAAAKALLDTVRVVLDGIDWAASDAIDARYAAIQFSYLYARETGDWSLFGGRVPAAAVANPKVTGDRAQFFAMSEAAGRAVIAAQLGDTTEAKAIVESLPERATIARGEVGGLLAQARGDTANWIRSLEAAAKIDAGVAHLGPPGSYPPAELLGDALLATGRGKDAVAAYRQQLALMPNRSRTLLLLARAQRAAGDVAGAAKTEAQLRRNWHAADAGVATRFAGVH